MWPLDGLRVFWNGFHFPLPCLCLRSLPLAWTVGKSLLSHKFVVCLCVFVLTFTPSRGCRGSQRAARGQPTATASQESKSWCGRCSGVECLGGWGGVVLPTIPKVYLSLLASFFFFFAPCVHVLGLWVYFCVLLFASSREPASEDTVCFSGVFQFCKCSQP